MNNYLKLEQITLLLSEAQARIKKATRWGYGAKNARTTRVYL